MSSFHDLNTRTAVHALCRQRQLSSISLDGNAIHYAKVSQPLTILRSVFTTLAT